MEQNLDPSLPAQPLTSLSRPTTPLPSPDPTSIPSSLITQTFTSTTTNLSSSSLGARILAQSDEFFASASNLLTPTPAINKPDLYIETGKWMDGWETRRHNPRPFDWVIISLGASGRIKGVEVDTSHFDGNHAPEIEVEGLFLQDRDGGSADGLLQEMAETQFEDTAKNLWRVLVPRKRCGPNARHAWVVEESRAEETISHMRLKMYPDGGIARLRVYGRVVPVWYKGEEDGIVELSAAKMGGLAVAWSDQHFGAASNLLLPGRGEDMRDGWETKRTRGEHVDWAVIKLGVRGKVGGVVVDTMHFRGNFPQAVRVEGWDDGGSEQETQGLSKDDWEKKEWIPIIKERKMKADELAFCELLDIVERKIFSHIRLTMIPDGGVKRLRIYAVRADAEHYYMNTLGQN